MNIPRYPQLVALAPELRESLHPRLSALEDGISEFTFANLYLFRHIYDYRTGLLPDGRLIVTGGKDDRRFLLFPEGIPTDDATLRELFATYHHAKCVAERHADSSRLQLEQMGLTVMEDRDNFDYLYSRKELASLAGRKYHKKRNLINAFINNYSYEELPLRAETLSVAFEVLEQWRSNREDDADYRAAHEALNTMKELRLCGCLVKVDGAAAAYTLGESILRGHVFVVHFEKAIGDYKGIYQFINRSFASALPRHIIHINREQDLGDPGLRQAKMTYRPSGFVKKYKIVKEQH